MRPLLLLAAAHLSTCCLAAGETPAPVGFRTDGNGRYPDATPPLEWGPTKNVAWKTAMPAWSNASPVLLGDLVITCAEPASVIGASSADGKQRWVCTDQAAPAGNAAPQTHKDNGYTSATPVSDGQRIFAVFGSGRAMACDRTGKHLWAVDLEVPPNNKWGSCMSPRLAGGLLIVHIDNLWGLDPATGAVRWKVKTPWTWGTPVVANVGGTEVVWTGGGAAIRASDGKQVASGPPKLEYNSPGLVDGVLYYVQTVPMAFRLGATPEAAPQPLWKGAIAKERYYATPLVHDGLLYAINQRAILSVLDIQDGKTVYEQKLDHLKGTVYPSPTLGGGQIYLSSEGGQTLVIKPGRSYQELARNDLEPFRSCPVFAGKRAYLRGQKNLWCFAAP